MWDLLVSRSWDSYLPSDPRRDRAPQPFPIPLVTAHSKKDSDSLEHLGFTTISTTHWKCPCSGLRPAVSSFPGSCSP